MIGAPGKEQRRDPRELLPPKERARGMAPARKLFHHIIPAAFGVGLLFIMTPGTP